MKRTCDGCRALNTTFKAECDLGFKISGNKQYYEIDVGWKPMEECPKPKTTSEYIYLHRMRMLEKPI